MTVADSDTERDAVPVTLLVNDTLFVTEPVGVKLAVIERLEVLVDERDTDGEKFEEAVNVGVREAVPVRVAVLVSDSVLDWLAELESEALEARSAEQKIRNNKSQMRAASFGFNSKEPQHREAARVEPLDLALDCVTDRARPIRGLPAVLMPSRNPKTEQFNRMTGGAIHESNQKESKTSRANVGKAAEKRTRANCQKRSARRLRRPIGSE